MRISQTTLGELYMSLNAEEIRGLDLYLQKNTVGKQNTLLLLHKFLSEAKDQKQLEKLDTEVLKVELFGGDAKSVSKLTTYNNLLSNHIKDYLLLSKIHEKNIYTETLWGEILIERSLRKNMLTKLNNNSLDDIKDDYSMFKKFLHARELFFYRYITLNKNNYSEMILSQRDQINAFNNYYSYYSLELYNSLISLSRVNNSENEYSREEILNFVKSHVDNSNMQIKIQALILQLLIEREDKPYLDLKFFFKQSQQKIPFDLKIKIIPALLNYCAYKIDRGFENYHREYYEIMNNLFDRNELFKEGVYSIFRLLTYIKTVIQYDKMEKAEYLLEESLKVIAPSQKDSFQYLIESRIAFAKKDYTLSLRKISTINPADSIYYYPQYKIMLIKCYIMLADIDRLMAERENFYKYITSHKNIQEDEKRRHKLYIKYTEYLTEARYIYLTDYMKKRIEQALLQTSPYFTEKQWVRERWESLKHLSIQTNE